MPGKQQRDTRSQRGGGRRRPRSCAGWARSRPRLHCRTRHLLGPAQVRKGRGVRKVAGPDRSRVGQLLSLARYTAAATTATATSPTPSLKKMPRRHSDPAHPLNKCCVRAPRPLHHLRPPRPAEPCLPRGRGAASACRRAQLPAPSPRPRGPCLYLRLLRPVCQKPAPARRGRRRARRGHGARRGDGAATRPGRC